MTVTAPAVGSSLPDPLAHLLRLYCDVNAYSSEALRQHLAGHRDAARVAAFRAQLADAIVSRSLTPQVYEALTGEDFDGADALDRHLRQLWVDLYGDSPIPGDRHPRPPEP